MSKFGRSSIRTYEMRLARNTETQKPECDAFHIYVEKVACNGREILDFRRINEQGKCEIELRFRSKSCGKTGPHRLTRNIELQYPDVIVVHVVRQRPQLPSLRT